MCEGCFERCGIWCLDDGDALRTRGIGRLDDDGVVHTRLFRHTQRLICSGIRRQGRRLGRRQPNLVQMLAEEVLVAQHFDRREGIGGQAQLLCHIRRGRCCRVRGIGQHARDVLTARNLQHELAVSRALLIEDVRRILAGVVGQIVAQDRAKPKPLGTLDSYHLLA